MCFLQRGKAVSPHDTYELVLDLYNEGIQLDVEDAETRAKLYHNRGIARLHLGHLMAALFDCFMSVETCPEAWQPYHLRARVYERIGEYTLAVQVGHPVASYILLHIFCFCCCISCTLPAACFGQCVRDDWVSKMCL